MSDSLPLPASAAAAITSPARGILNKISSILHPTKADQTAPLSPSPTPGVSDEMARSKPVSKSKSVEVVEDADAGEKEVAAEQLEGEEEAGDDEDDDDEEEGEEYEVETILEHRNRGGVSIYQRGRLTCRASTNT